MRKSVQAGVDFGHCGYGIYSIPVAVMRDEDRAHSHHIHLEAGSQCNTAVFEDRNRSMAQQYQSLPADS